MFYYKHLPIKIGFAVLTISFYLQPIKAQDILSKSEISFSKIKTKAGTRDVTTVNDYGKKWKMRVNFPESIQESKGLIIALHWAGGGNTYKEFNDCLALPGLKPLNAIIVSPEGENQLWSSENNVEKILSILKYAKKYWNIDTNKIAITGYSNGGNGSWYFAQNHPDLFSAAVPIASAYEINSKIDIPLYVIHGAKDELFDVARTKKWIQQTKEKGSNVHFIVNQQLSHFQGCSYIEDLKGAGEWLLKIWD